MRIGMVGLGRMGANMTTRLLRSGHEVVVYDVNPESVTRSAGEGAVASGSLAELVEQLPAPRAVWVMVPAGAITASTITELAALLDAGDTVVDGGNSRWTDTMRHAETLAGSGIQLLDAGTSGGVWGLQEGYCLMVGGDKAAFARLEPVLKALAPQDGYAHVGPSGAGHYVKMVHNGVEYALMQAYGEGFALLDGCDFELDLAGIAELWRHGSVVRSWLLDLAAAALKQDADLASISGHVEDSGEGRWTVEAAIDAAVPTPGIAQALFARFASRSDDLFGDRLIAALRQQFGGHAVRPADEAPEGPSPVRDEETTA